MSAALYTLALEQGATFDQTVTVKSSDGSYRDLTGYSARLKVKESPGDAADLLSLTSPAVAGLGLDLGGVAGTVRIQVPAATTAALDFYLVSYDLEIVSPAGVVTRVLQGKCTLSHEVTS